MAAVSSMPATLSDQHDICNRRTCLEGLGRRPPPAGTDQNCTHGIMWPTDPSLKSSKGFDIGETDLLSDSAQSFIWDIRYESASCLGHPGGIGLRQLALAGVVQVVRDAVHLVISKSF